MASFIDRYLSSRRTAFVQQTATPAAEQHLGLPQGERTYTMFVQTARAGTWEAKAGEDGVYTLTLTGLPAQTVYFSDRPERVVGTQTTTEFLQALGFAGDNPLNAALVTKADDGGDDVLVIELFNPAYKEGETVEGATLVYDARILENYRETNLGGVALEQDDASIPAAFDGASLFIDDCSDGLFECYKRVGNNQWVYYDSVKFGCCYRFPQCYQCHSEDGICSTLPGCDDDTCRIGGLGKACLF